MDLSEYAESLRRELLGITRFASEDISQAAQMLAESLDSSVRLALLDVLSAAADEISTRLDGATIDVRLTGMEPEFVVTISQEEEGQTDGPDESDAADAGQTRLTLRMPESLKARVESAAAASGQSVNAWLVRAITQALGSPAGRSRPRPTVGKRYTGFARS
jgi:HicB family